MDYNQLAPKSEKNNYPNANMGINSVGESPIEHKLDQFPSQEKEQSINNLQALGNKVVNSSEQQNLDSNPQELGKIIDLYPSNHVSASQVSSEAISRTPFKKEAIKTRDNLSKEGIRETENIISQFKQDGNAADFYETARDMMEANLDNSYNRKLAS